MFSLETKALRLTVDVAGIIVAIAILIQAFS